MTLREQKDIHEHLRVYSWSFVFKTQICYETIVRDLRAFRKGEYRRELANYATE